jgi:hypothetical protein
MKVFQLYLIEKWISPTRSMFCRRRNLSRIVLATLAGANAVRYQIFFPPPIAFFRSRIYRVTTYSPDPALWYYRLVQLAKHGISQCLGGHA